MNDDLSAGRRRELELLALRSLVPRMWAAVLCMHDPKMSKSLLDANRAFDDIKNLTHTDAEARFIVDYLQGVLRDVNEHLNRYESDISSGPRRDLPPELRLQLVASGLENTPGAEQ